jgi:hypothetical protein
MDLKETGINMSNWVDSAKDREYWRTFVNVALNLLVPLCNLFLSGPPRINNGAHGTEKRLLNSQVGKDFAQ